MPISSSIRLPRFAPSAAHLSTQSRAPSAAFLLRPHGLPPSGELRCAGDVHSEIRVLHHVPAKIVSKARRELVVIEEVECEHLGGFEPIHASPTVWYKLLKLILDLTSTPPGPPFPTPIRPSPNPKACGCPSRISRKPSPYQLLMLDLLGWQYLRRMHDTIQMAWLGLPSH
ncbi:uncharacterized protein BXZ73DRAFT_109145 [Epithele typhae]|uniref:uncharacterized protein n=1 Tax=Epithele typhae TaxID=378194 RepID=UPI002007E9DE|nr:uncharacterized protein BXZ73DRAFT_109145 [Epithele typhae]KAH9910343.1 hypothetical protein BXZ73DRAFT_109145 [Epithele typhae]